MQEHEMRLTGLKELYIRLSEYIAIYNAEERYAPLLAEVRGRLEAVSGDRDVDSFAKNPRGAGRQAHQWRDVTEDILKLRAEGQSIREISRRTYCSVGYVHKIIMNSEGHGVHD